MRTHEKVALAVLASAAVFAARSAWAAPMDPTPDRLFLDNPGLAGSGLNCQGVASNPESVLANAGIQKRGGSAALPNAYPCLPNNAAWANMMYELGHAIAPTAFHPARTTGYGGFALSLEASYAKINADGTDGNGVQYWHQGTQGNPQPNGSFSTVNSGPDSILQIYTLKARKGLPFGFEIAGALGLIANTTLWLGGADLHWAILEGYRTGFLGYIPDISIGGGVRTLSGQQSFYLTTVGIDAELSKPIALADSAVLTPYIGAQRLIIYANSSIVNLTPSVDPLQACGYAGQNVADNPLAPGNTGLTVPNDPKSKPWTKGQFDGSPVCKNTLSNHAPNNSDFNNQSVFQKQTFNTWRGIAGLTYRYELLYLAAQFALDMEDSSAENSGLSGGPIDPKTGSSTTFALSGARQWTLSLEAGVFF
ncbi:MAG TPA: hypothetical protein VF765_24965 [Polyangiaceae bacterium]